MDILVSMLYTATLAAIRIWLLLKHMIVSIFIKPLKALMQRKMSENGIGALGKEPQDLVVHNDRFYHRVICYGTLGLAEAYVDGWFDCKKLDVFLCKAIKDGLFQELQLFPWDRLMHYLKFDAFNLQTVGRASEVADKHYNLGNHFFKAFLDKSMTYSCAYWEDAQNLDEAQQQKMKLIGRKLALKPGMRVLDLGCGWGALCKFLAETYDVHVVGVTISKDGADEARERCKGLSVEIRCEDYRDINESFDRIVSVGSFEHVGPKNYRTFFELTHRCLSDDGILLLHTIVHDNDLIPPIDFFVDKYLFPNIHMPNHKQIPKAVDNLFCIEDVHNFGPHYDRTLMAWHDNFVRNWQTVSHKYENANAFYRTWTYFLQMFAALFRARTAQLWQIVLTKSLPGGYISVR